MVFLLVVLVIVLLLSARAWRSVAPTALDLVPQLSGNGDAPSENRPEPVRGAGHIPDLKEMRKKYSTAGRIFWNAFLGLVVLGAITLAVIGVVSWGDVKSIKILANPPVRYFTVHTDMI